MAKAFVFSVNLSFSAYHHASIENFLKDFFGKIVSIKVPHEVNNCCFYERLFKVKENNVKGE